MKKSLANLVTVFVTVIISLLLGEAAVRMAFGIPVFHIENFRVTQVIRDTMSDAVAYDPLLGWHLKPFIPGKRGGFSTLDYGIRKNNESDDHVRTGGVLVAGSSFAAGSEVGDEDTFPAQLENLIGMPVVNGAIGGFGVDQIVLRAEQLLPIVKPKILIVDISTSNIALAGYSEAGAAKPYYTIGDNALVLHNSPPVSFVHARGDRFDGVKRIAGYSYAINRFMGAFFPDDWFNDKNVRNVRINNDPAEVSCLLLTRLEGEARSAGVTRFLLSVQYGGQEVEAWKEIPGDLATVEDCSRDLGIEVVDEFDGMKALSKDDAAKFGQDYVLERPGNIFGHKSAQGNRHVAERLAAELAKEPPPLVKRPVVQRLVAGDGINLLANLPALQSSAIAHVEPLADGYRLEAVGEKAEEHYIGLSLPAAVAAGPFTLSLQARAAHGSRVRLQIVTAKSDGVLGSFDLDDGTALPQSLGNGRQIHAGIGDPVSGWTPLTLGVTLPERATPSVVVGLIDSHDASSFMAAGESVEIRHLKLERGQTATPYAALDIMKGVARK